MAQNHSSLSLRIDTSGEGVIFGAVLNKVHISCSLRDYSLLYIIR